MARPIYLERKKTALPSLDRVRLMEQYVGTITRIVFHNEETGYTVLRLALDRDGGKSRTPDLSLAVFEGDSKSRSQTRQASLIDLDSLPKLITVVGPFAGAEAGQQLRVLGEWMEHPIYGSQFKADKWEVMLPTTLYGIQAYLSSGMVKGIGPTLASAIVDTFKENTFDIIDRMPQRLLEVPGIGEGRLKMITDLWQEHSAIRSLMAFLQGQNLAPALAIKIYKALGPTAAQVIQDDPYRLTEVRGIGFKTADRIALQFGRPHDSMERIAAGVIFALEEFAEKGHTYMPYSHLVAVAASLLELPPPAVAAVIRQLAGNDERIRVEGDPQVENPEPAVYLRSLYLDESETAQLLLKLARHPLSALDPLRAELTMEQVYWSAAMAGQSELSEEQHLAIRRAVEHKLSIITGGPGTGKTMCLRTLVTLLGLYRYRFVLVSPTGRAARRLAEATGHEAYTIHRLLRYSGATFSEEEIPADMVIVDEASMVDLTLMKHLLGAIKPTTHLVLVGDADQLPSVGPGTVLKDVIASELAAVTRMTHIFRQAQSSWIVSNAHRINQGHMPLTPQRDCDFYLFTAQNTSHAADLIVDIVCRRIPEQFGETLGLTDPLRDIQVIAPMYKGLAGVERLNTRLQELLNPPAQEKPERALPRCVFRVGDKVMVTRNDYEREVSNGDIGYVVDIDKVSQEITVCVDGRSIIYDGPDTDDLVHAFAVSIHKAQGSEYPAVVIPVLSEHAIMLYRQLLYTAVTRARRLCVLVGSRSAIEMAVNTNRGPERYAGLAARLQPDGAF
jgi:exodeoxyribonuclease V alpha subunit